MEITIPYIENKFREFNAQMFGGELPLLPIRLSKARTRLGACTFRKRRRWYGMEERYDFALSISTAFDLSEQELEDVIIHEMIHYYIGYNKLKDTSAHGKIFRRLMEEINERFGRHLTISYKSTPADRIKMVDMRPRRHAVAVVTMNGGRTGIKVIPYTVRSIRKYYSGVKTVKEVCSVAVYSTLNPFFNRFPSSSALRIHYLSDDEIRQHLADAEPLNLN